MLLLAANKSRFTVNFSVSTYLSFLPALTFSLLIAYLHYTAAYTVADRLFPDAQCTRTHIRSLLNTTPSQPSIPLHFLTIPITRFVHLRTVCSASTHPPFPAVHILHSWLRSHARLTRYMNLSMHVRLFILELLITYLISHKKNLTNFVFVNDAV